MLQLIECVMNGSGKYTNTSNQFVYVYANGVSVTVKDGAGNVVQTNGTPCWVPPSFSVATGTAGQILLGLQGNLSDFSGFLSRAKSGAAVPGGSLQYTVGAGQKTLTETETWANPLTGGLSVLQEGEAWTHA